MQNPYIALLRIAWTYARHEKRQYILVYCLFILANIVSALRPLLYGWFVGQLQQQGTDVFKLVWLFVGAYWVLSCWNGGFMARRASWNDVWRSI